MINNLIIQQNLTLIFLYIKGIIFHEFNEFWTNLIHNDYFGNQPSIMQFEKVSKIFFGFLKNKLQNDPNTVIKEKFMEKMCLNFSQNKT